MEACAIAQATCPEIERRIAQGFWYLERFVPEWSNHPNFPRPYEEQYYQAACERLSDLAYWFFFGESPYEGGGWLRRCEGEIGTSSE